MHLRRRSSSADGQQRWTASPSTARLVRLAIFATPILVGWLAVRLLDPVFVRPGGRLVGAGAWIIQAIAVAAVVGAAADRVARRALPLATLLGMTLTFPDRAPSRFGVALRVGTVGRLQSQLDDVNRNGLGPDAASAAIRAVELITTLGRHERLTRGHSERVRAYADLIAEELELSERDRQKLAWGVLLHDIGKLGVPASILSKPGRPTDEEWRVIATHPTVGNALLQPMAEWLGPWHLAAAHHHERWDGTGYPRGLAGTDISLAGRITSVADAYDVMTSRRSYKKPMPVADARQELVAGAGTQFDPDVVRALLQASVRTRFRSGPLGWLPELPRIGSVVGSAASSTTAAVALAVPVAVATQPPGELGYVDTGGGAVSILRPDDTDPAAGTPSPAAAPPHGADTDATEGGGSGDETIDRGGEAGAPPSTGGSTTSVPAAGAGSGSGSGASTTEAPASTSTTIDATTTTVTIPAPTTTSTTITTTSSISTTTTLPPVGPTAVDDSAGTVPAVPAVIPVLLNDIEGDAPFDTVTVVDPPARGTASPGLGNTVVYTPDLGFVGEDSFTYEVCDTEMRCDTATVEVEVELLGG